VKEFVVSIGKIGIGVFSLFCILISMAIVYPFIVIDAG